MLDALVVALNRADFQHGIDTLRRDEAADAHFVLAKGMGIGDKDAETWLDATPRVVSVTAECGSWESRR